MAVEELEKMTEDVVAERKKKFYLTEIKNNREEIRKICENTINYAPTVFKELPKLPEWGIVSSCVIELMTQTFIFLATKTNKDMKEVQVELDGFFKVSIEYGTTKNADKDATFNPKFEIGEELRYDNDNPSNNKLSTERPNLNLNADIEFIAKGAQNTLKSMYGITVEDWRDIVSVAVCTLRQERQYLIDHKDDTEWGVLINFAEVFDMQIEKSIEEDGTTKYHINLGAGKGFKLPAKSDEDSENN